MRRQDYGPVSMTLAQTSSRIGKVLSGVWEDAFVHFLQHQSTLSRSVNSTLFVQLILGPTCKGQGRRRRPNFGRSFLACFGQEAVCHLLVTSGADPHPADSPEGERPIDRALRNSHTEIVVYLERLCRRLQDDVHGRDLSGSSSDEEPGLMPLNGRSGDEGINSCSHSPY